MIRVLFCRSNPIAPDPRVEKEAAALLDAGYEVTVIAWDRSGREPRKEIRGRLVIERIPVRAGYAQGLGNLPALLRWQVKLTAWIIRHRGQFDVLHACDFDTVLPALMARFLFGKRLVYDIFDFYADHLRNTPRWIKRVIRKVDFYAIRKADAVILADDSRTAQIKGSRPRQLIVIYNTPEDCYQALASETRTQPSRLELIYVGLLQVERGLLELLEVMKRHPSWHLYLAGFGGEEAVILKEAEGLPNVSWHGRIPYQKTLELTAASDVSIATYDPAIANHRYASPNKIFEAMMLAKPVVVARGTQMDEIIKTWECGLTVRYGNLRELEESLEILAEDPDFRETLGMNGRRAYQESYSWDTMRDRLLALYGKL